YGNGFQQLWGNFFSNWGPHFDEIDSVAMPHQFLADPTLRDAFPEYYFKRYAYEAKQDPTDFFRKGLVSNTSLSFAGGTDKLGYNAAVAYTSEQGYAPGNDLTRMNISTGFNAAVTNKMTIRTSMMYANTDVASPPLNGATGGGAAFGGVPSLYANFLYTPRSVDILNWPFETPLDHRCVNFRSGIDIPSARWIAKYATETDKTDRFFISTTTAYDFSESLNLSYRVGFDTYTQRQDRAVNKGIGPTYPVINNGILVTQTISNTIWNHDLILAFDKELTSDISVIARVGGNARNDYFIRDGLYGENQTVFGLLRHSNFQTSSSRSVAFDGRVFYRTVEQQRYGVYGDFSFDYKDYVFVNLSGRNDWSSSLEPGNNTKFYPSASVSFVPTDAFSGMKSSMLNFLKLRFSYGTSAGFPSPYNTRSVVAQNLRGYMDLAGNLYGEHTIANRLGNRMLRPELIQELEAGFEARFINDRLSVDFTIYDRSTKDLITLAPIDPTTGYTETLTNLGKLSNKGIEVAVNATPVRLENGFEWNVTWNFTQVKPMVETLAEGIDEVVLSGFTDLGNFAIPGRPTNIIKGTAIRKDPDGNRIVGSDGLYVLDPLLQELGDPNPKYITSLINNFSWKGITLSMQWDYRYGGRMYAATPSALIGRGVSKDVDFNHDLTFVLPGVKNIGTAESPNYVPNDIQITASDYGFNTQFFGYNEVAMFDATTIRLREVAIGYTLPNSILSKTPFKNVSLILTGNNLFHNAVNVPKYVNFDPEVSSLGVDNGYGFDYLTGPSFKRYGAVLRCNF
ncbi:MAG TPA: TonB-dependent receptor, partial [Chryseosolibacter sp.]|nr:TonB-dependent receptor [Chryseosolibacter sp.]